MTKKTQEKKSSPFTWQLASLNDLEAAITLSVELYQELDPVHRQPLSLERVGVYLYELISQEKVVLYMNNGVACGIVALDYYSDWYAEPTEKYMTNVIFYIKPEFRNFRAFTSALRMVEQYAKINKTQLDIHFISDKDVKRKFKAFKHRGYTSRGFMVSRRFD